MGKELHKKKSGQPEANRIPQLKKTINPYWVAVYSAGKASPLSHLSGIF